CDAEFLSRRQVGRLFYLPYGLRQEPHRPLADGQISAQRAATAAQKIATRGEHALERKRTWRSRSERGDPT
ncbi:MAG TPA: hypothetical protein VFR54_00285, partial [Xanthobacteraceae bacterium]|nr:hypothetical protein [Xanthobacteraceae bacterium]